MCSFLINSIASIRTLPSEGLKSSLPLHSNYSVPIKLSRIPESKGSCFFPFQLSTVIILNGPGGQTAVQLVVAVRRREQEPVPIPHQVTAVTTALTWAPLLRLCHATQILVVSNMIVLYNFVYLQSHNVYYYMDVFVLFIFQLSMVITLNGPSGPTAPQHVVEVLRPG